MGEWISVEDRLPEEMGLYLINYVYSYSDNDGFQAIGTTLFIDGSFVGLLSVYKVTHWMNLPEPPKE